MIGWSYIRRFLLALPLFAALLLTGCGSASPDFSIAVTPAGQSIQAGSSRQWSLVATARNGFHGTVSVSLSGLPSGVSGPARFVLQPGLSQTITLIAADSATVGSATIMMRGQSGTLVRSTQWTLTVTPPPADFSLSAGPSSLILQAGGASQAIQLTVDPQYGFSSPVAVTFSGIPPGISATPSSPTLIPGVAAPVLFSAQSSAAVGGSTITVTGTAGSLTHSVSIPLAVSAAGDFTLSASPLNITVQAGNGGRFSISATDLNGFDLPINVAVSGLPSGVSASPSAFSLLPGASQTIDLRSTADVAVGQANLMLTASAGSLTHTAMLAVVIQPRLTISVYPATFDLAPGLSQTLTVSATDGGLGTQPIAVTLQGLPPGIAATPASTSLLPGAPQSVVFTADDNFSVDGSATLQASVDSVIQTQQLAFHALPVATTMVTDGLMAYFPMSEGQGASIYDISGSGYSGTFGGSGNTWASGGVSLSGNGWIDLPPDLNTAQTIQMWLDVPASQPAVLQTLVGTGGNAGGDSFVWALRDQSLFLTYNGITGTVAASPLNGSAAVALVEGAPSANSLDQYWVDDTQSYVLEPTYSAVAGLPIPGHLQIGASEGLNGLSGTVGPVAFYDRPLSAAEVAQNAAFFKQLEQAQNVETEEGDNSTQSQFIAMGDSITFGLGASVPYCNVLAEPAFYSLCLGFIGQTTSLGVSQAPVFANYYNRHAQQNILFNWYMSNDVEAGVPNPQIMQNLQATCRAIKQVYPGWVALVGTMMSRVGIPDASRFALNDMVRQEGSSECDGYVDIAADPALGASGAYAGGYFQDQVHPNDAGNKEIAAILTRYINSVNGATATNPTLQSSSTYTMTTADNFVQAAPDGDGSWRLPECIALTGKVYTVANQGSGSLSFAGANGEVINGSAVILPDTTGAFQIELASDANGGCQWTRQ